MRWGYIFNVVGILSLCLGITMIFPLLCGLYYHDNSIFPLLYSMAVTIVSGIGMHLLFRSCKADIITQREGMAIVTLGWIIIGIFGALPFYFCGTFDLFVDAFFESVSGFTTTGASVLTNIEGVSKGILFWRSFIQWLGGMGIIVLSLAILPFLGVGGMQLYKAEVPSPVPDKLKPRLRETAKILWKVYLLISLIQIALLMFGGMSLYDSLCHSFTTMPTGGFSTKNVSIAHYDSAYFDTVIIIFMMLAGVNFSLHYQALRGRPLIFWRDSECRFFIILFFILSIAVSADIYFNDLYDSVFKAFRFASFQVSSIITTTGFATADYELWPPMSQMILLFCMIIGASAGSTGGGIKCIRLMLCFKYCYKELYALIHPHGVKAIKFGGKSVDDAIVSSIMGFLALYMGLFALSTIILAGMGVDFVTSIGAVAASIGNIGPGFGGVGPVDNYATIPYWGKWLLVWCMLLGRLEVYTVIIFFVPEFWRK